MSEDKIIVQVITKCEELVDLIADRIMQKLDSPNSKANQEIEEELLTIKQMAQFFQVTETTIHQWKNDGVIPYIRIKSRIRFKKSEVLQLHEKRRRQK